MSDTTTASFGDNKDTWRTATLVMGFALLISFAAHVGGPSSANAASGDANHLQILQQNASQPLSIGGFTTYNDQPAFIVLNEQGQRVGSLPMSSAPAPSEQRSGQD